MVGGKEKPSGLCHKTPPNMAPYNNETKILKSNKKDTEKPKEWKIGTGRRCDGNTNPRGTQKNR